MIKKICRDQYDQRATQPFHVSIVWSAIRKGGCQKESDFAKYELYLPNYQSILNNMVTDKFLECKNNIYKIPDFEEMEKVNFFKNKDKNEYVYFIVCLFI